MKFDSQSSSNKLPSVMTADTLNMCLVQFQEENRTLVVTKRRFCVSHREL